MFVNRLWYLFFGVGIARDLDDFGGQGEPPLHPELLDQLAVEFVDSGWDIKALAKRIVMSRTYRQSSLVSDSLAKRDPYNQFFARQSRFRLPAEMVRDTALAVGGILNLEYGGGSIKPYQPAGYYRHLNFPQRKYAHHDDARQWRRGVYMHWQRQFLHPMLRAFDAPRREECTAERSRSNTPIAALNLLNDPTFVEAARGLAALLLEPADASTAERVRLGFRRATSRPPDHEETAILTELYEVNLRHYRENSKAAQALLGVGLMPPTSSGASAEDTARNAAWTSVARALLNLNETITRN